MSREVELHLEPTGEDISVDAGASLQDTLFEQDVEFPCGGQGTCGKCRVRVVNGRLDATFEDTLLLGEDAVNEGWRLACRGQLDHDVTLQLAQWDTQVLSDDTPLEVCPRDGWAIAVDLGTTTVAAQMVDLTTGSVLAVQTGVNPQATCGADVMSRIHYAVHDGGAERLTAMVRRYLGQAVRILIEKAERTHYSAQPVREIVLVGNSVMHHLFAAHSVAPLARVPFNSVHLAEASFTARDLDWELPEECLVRFLPCLGGFIGSDVLAGLLATGMDRSARLQVLVDLGTNGEIVVAEGGRMLCAATAAGPAFEGARIRMGMRATSGAIDRVTAIQGNSRSKLDCHVLGGGEPRGICGSGLVDAASSALLLDLLAPNGRLQTGSELLPLAGEVALHQCDVRELQLAKGAIAAGIEMLLGLLGKEFGDVDTVYLSGAFGNYLDIESARQLGLLPFATERVSAMGNTALRGAKLALVGGEEVQRRLTAVCQRIEHVAISEDSRFMDVYVRNMTFPAERISRRNAKSGAAPGPN